MKNPLRNAKPRIGPVTRRWFSLDKARDWGDFLLKCTSIVAILGGGGWAFYQFVISDTLASNVQMTIDTQVIKYSDKSGTLFVRVKSKNVGKTAIEAGKDGMAITVRRLPDALSDGYVEPGKLPKLYQGKIDFKKLYTGYTIEPGVEQEDVATFILPKGATYLIDAELDLDSDGNDPTLQNAFAIVKVE